MALPIFISASLTPGPYSPAAQIKPPASRRPTAGKIVATIRFIVMTIPRDFLQMPFEAVEYRVDQTS